MADSPGCSLTTYVVDIKRMFNERMYSNGYKSSRERDVLKTFPKVRCYILMSTNLAYTGDKKLSPIQESSYLNLFIHVLQWSKLFLAILA